MNAPSVFIFVLLLSFSCFTKGDTVWSDCGWAGVRFKHFTLFPNPVQVGQSVHVLAVVSLDAGISAGDLVNGTMTMDIKYNGGAVFTLTNIPLCNSTDAIVCSTLAAGDNTINFDFQVPEMPAGTYSITAFAKPGVLQPGCIQFDVTVQDPTQNGKYQSYITAQLAGTAQFENPNYLNRGLGEIVQVGPVGSVSSVYSYSYQWGTFISVAGSQDVIEPYFNPSGYVWGLSGSMTEMLYLNTTRYQTFQGTFFVGYVSSLSKRTLDVPILDGTFNLTWSYSTVDGIVASNLTGTITFSDIASLPMGWSHCITLGRFGSLSAETSSEGMLTVSGTKNYCTSSGPCVIASPTQPKKDTHKGMSKSKLGLIVGLGVGIPVVALLMIALILCRRHRKRYEEEDGIFSAARKPEYGNALVVDDIIQETREHGGNSTLIPRLDRHPGDTNSDYSDSEDDMSLSEAPRGRERERSLSPDARSYSDDGSRPPRYTRSRSRDSRDSYSDSRSDAGSSASRSSDDEEDR